jgi:hypothetical protein
MMFSRKVVLPAPVPPSNDAMLDAHGIRPEPRLFVDVVAENRGLVANRSFDDGCVSRAGNRLRPGAATSLRASRGGQ